MKKIAILGAGISGLAVAWWLKERWGGKVDLAIYEKSDRVGGLIRSTTEEGFHCEWGPRGFRPAGKGEVTLELVKAIGLEKELLAASDNARARYIGYGGKLHRFSPLFLLKQGVIGACFHDFSTPATQLEDESIAQFSRRRFNRRITERIIDPMVIGTFGGHADLLSVRSCFPLLWNWEQLYGSVLKGFIRGRKGKKRTPRQPALYTFSKGMELLPKTIAERLEIPIYLNRHIKNWDEVESDRVISTLPAYALAPLLPSPPPIDYSTLSLVHLGWNQRVLKKSGYGFLLPSEEKAGVLGMTWDSEMFPQFNQGLQTRATAMILGSYSKEELIQRTLHLLQKYLGIDQKADFCITTEATKAIPQYHLFHHRTLEGIRKQLPPHVVAFGNYFEGAGINDLIAHARQFVANLEPIPKVSER
jgi:oxygen-dependent protoporphyrinogen oxidase